MTILAAKWSDDVRWIAIWVVGLLVILVWSGIVLSPASFQVLSFSLGLTLGFGALVVMISGLLGWLLTMTMHFASRAGMTPVVRAVLAFTDAVRSIPQIVGLLAVYLVVGQTVQTETVTSVGAIVILLSCGVSLFVFLEVYDIMMARIDYHAQSELMNAMRVCGMRELRIVNVEILRRNSGIFILQKLASLFAVTVFLLCSVDFVLSVGLSPEIHSSNLPPTLGSTLARLDSKQDLLALGMSPGNWSIIPRLFDRHWQGLATALIIIFTLVSFHRIVRGLSRRLS